MNQRPTKTKSRQCCDALLVTVLLLIVFRNPVTRIAAVAIGSHFLGTQVEIDRVRIGWLKVGVTGIRIQEPDSADVQIEIAQLVVGLTPWDGIRHGIWANRIVLQKPSLHLRFDRNGNLITKFPAAGDPQPTAPVIPIREVLVHEASVHVHQVERESFAIENAEFAARFGDTIQFRGRVPDLFGGVARLRTDVDASSLSGQSKLIVEGVSLDTQLLAELPLLPPAINLERISATASLSLAIEHPPNELALDRQGVELRLNLRDLHSHQMGRIGNSISITAQNHGGVIDLNARGDVLDGVLALDATSDLLADPVTANVSSTAQRCNLGKIAACFVPAIDLQSMASLQANATLVCDTKAISFAGSVQTLVSDIHVDNISIADVTGEITTSGVASLTKIGQLTGSVDGKVQSGGVSLTEITQYLGLPESNGRIAASADFHISLADLDKVEAHTATAFLRASNVSTGELSLQDTVGAFQVERGIASMIVEDAAVYDTRLTQVALCSVSAHAPLAVDGTLTTSVDISLSPTSAVARLLGIESDQCGGSLTAHGSATCLLRDVVKPQSWLASARIQSQQLVFADESIGNFDANIYLSDGQFSIPEFPVQWRESGCTIEATGTVADRVEVRGSIVANPVRIRNIAQLVSRFSSSRFPAGGLADLEGEFRIATGPMEFEASGTATLNDASYAGNAIGQANLTWQADLQSFKLRSSSNSFLGGQYSIEATARELDWTKTVIEARFVDISTARLTALSGQQIPVSGVVDGGIRVTSIESLESIAGRAWVKSRGMSVHQVPLEISVADISFESSAIVLACEGFVGDGRFSGNANSNLRQLIEFVRSRDPQIQRIPLIAQARLHEVSIATLARGFDLTKTLRSPRGKLNATCDRDSTMLDGSMLCSATASISALQLNQVRLADRITGEISVRGDRLLIQRVDGRFADGSLSGKAELQFASNPTGDFEFAASRVNLRRAAAPFVNGAVSGIGTIRVRGRIGQVINGRADVSLLQGVLAGVSVQEAKFPIDWSYSRPSKVARWQCRAGMVSAGGGKIRISSEGNYGSNLNMTTSARIERVDTSKLLRGKSVGAGIVDGNMTLQAKRARSLKQFFGKFDLKLSETETLEMPVLDQLPKLVSLFPRRPGQGEDGGTVHGRIAGGLLHVDELAISQSNVQILMSGNATLEGRLNFDVTASTQSNGPGDQLLSLVDSPLMLAAPAPIALIAKANNLLKDRVVHVHVGGIAARPTLRLQPGKQLSQDAVRFFLASSIGGRATEIATQQAQTKRR